MPKALPMEFKEDVLRVARNRDSRTSIEQIARGSGVSTSCLQRWLTQEAVVEGVQPGVRTDMASENRELRRRDRRHEQENNVLRRAAAYLSQANLKMGDSPK